MCCFKTLKKRAWPPHTAPDVIVDILQVQLPLNATATATVAHSLLIPILVETIFQVHRSSFHSVYTSATETPIDGWQGQSGSFSTEWESAESRNLGKNNPAILPS